MGIFGGRLEERARGPQAFTVTRDQRLVLVDNEKTRLLFLGPTGLLERAAPLPADGYLTSLAGLEDGRLAGYDARGDALLLLDASGRRIDRRPLPAAFQPFAGLSALADRLVLRAGNRHHTIPIGAGDRLEMPDTRRDTHAGRPLPDGREVQARKTGPDAAALYVLEAGSPGPARVVPLSSPTPGALASATVMGADRSGRLFVRLETLEAGSPLRVRRFMQVFDPALRPLDTFEYPLEGVIVAEDDVQIDARGEVYLLLPYADRVEVLRYVP